MITVNMDKAKSIGHDIRRYKRDEAFKPFDDVIAKQIPGKDAQAAESERQKIRDADAAVQSAINTATDPEQIKEAIFSTYPL